jgi:hypothetical protein
MSKSKGTFVDLALEGQVLSEEIDDFVDQWHEKPPQQPLHKFLGFSRPEYALWVEQPDMLDHILRARRENLSLASVISEDYELRMAARSGNTPKLRRLKAWLKKEGLVE